MLCKTGPHSILAFTHLHMPMWIIHYHLKDHVQTKPYTIVERKSKIFAGDIILETGEVILPVREFPD